MSTVLETVERPDSFVMPPYFVRRFTVAEYHQMIDSGVLEEGARLELLEGWIVPKVTINPPHAWTVSQINRILTPVLSDEWGLRGQSPITTLDSEPEPDAAIVRGPDKKYLKRHPSGSEVGLVIEVADTSLMTDRHKATIYATDSIPIYWIMNLTDRQIEIFSDPDTDNRTYRNQKVLLPGMSIDLVLDGQLISQLPVEEMLPPKTL